LPPGALSAQNSLTKNSLLGQWRRQGEEGKLPPYGWTSKIYVICVCFHCHGTSCITRQIHCKAVEQRAKLIHRQYNRDWGTSHSRPPIDPYLTSPRYKIWRRHCLLTTIKVNMIVCLMKVIKVAYRNELLLFCLPTCLYIGYSIAQCFTFGPTAANRPKFGRGGLSRGRTSLPLPPGATNPC